MNYIEIGKIYSTHGLNGNVSIVLHKGNALLLKKMKHFFIGLKRESYIPFFIQEIIIENNQECLVKFEDVDSVEQAKKLNAKPVFLRTDQHKGLDFSEKEINFIGFEVKDKEVGVLGKVEELFETPGQLLATVNYQGKEVIFPINDSTLVSVNIELKILVVALPDGLLDVYLKS